MNLAKSDAATMLAVKVHQATLIQLPNDGHAFMLQRDAPVADKKIADWLDKHNAQLPKC